MTIDPARELLERLVANPADVPRIVQLALDAKPPGLLDALKTDRRFGPHLRAACRDLGALGRVPYLVQFLGHLRYEPAVPELLAVWRAGVPGLSYQAGQALLKIGEPNSLRAVAADLATVAGTARGVAVEAAFRLGASEAYELLRPDVASQSACVDAALHHLLAEPELFRADPRWQALAVRVFREGQDRVRDAARSLLLRHLSGAELGQLFEDPPPSTKSEAEREAELEGARAKLTKLRAGLPSDVWREPPASRATELRLIEATLGPLPALVRAFYELMDGLEVPGRTPRDRFVIRPLAEATKALQRWQQEARPHSTPRSIWPPFHFPVAPDGYERAGLSGGPDIGFELPTLEADPPLLHLRGTPRFSVFVRRALRAVKKQAQRPP